jgi:Flp pilus assembly pilin Flp
MLLRHYVRIRAWGARAVDRLTGEDGATAVEYALMLALIFMAVFFAVALLGQNTSSSFDGVDFGP